MSLPFEYLKNVQENESRPLWSVMIPVFNCSLFLEYNLQALMQHALSDDEMEIVVVDDCSTDNPEAIVEKWGEGRVRFVRQPYNVGHTANFKTCLLQSRGKLIHILHGDDRILPGFYESFTNFFERNPPIMAAFCNCNFIDEENKVMSVSASSRNETGLFPDFFEHITRGQIIQTPTMVVRREVYEKIGMFNRRLSWCEDWEMWARIGKNYQVGFINKVLAEYRVHKNSNSSHYIKSGENIRDIKRGISIINSYIDNRKNRGKSKRIVTDMYVNTALKTASDFLEKKQVDAARNQLAAAFLMSDNIRLNLRIIKLVFKSYY